MTKSKFFFCTITLFCVFQISIISQSFTITNKPTEGTVPFGSETISLVYSLSYSDVIHKNLTLRIYVDGSIKDSYYLYSTPPSTITVSYTEGIHNVKFEMDSSGLVPVGLQKLGVQEEEFTVSIKYIVQIGNNFDGGKVIVNGVPEDAPYYAELLTSEGCGVGAVEQNYGGYNRVWSTSGTSTSTWTIYRNNQSNQEASQSFSFSGASYKNASLTANLRKVCNTTFNCNGEGGTIIVTQNGVSTTVPASGQTFNVIESNSISAAAVNGTCNGIDYVFENWPNNNTNISSSFSPSGHTTITANFKGYPNVSMMNVQCNSANGLGQGPTITWTDNPNQAVSYQISKSKYKPSNNTVINYGVVATVPPGVGYYHDGNVITNDKSSADILTIEVQALYTTANTTRFAGAGNFYIATGDVYDPGDPGTQKRNQQKGIETVITKYSVVNYPNPFNPSTVINYQVLESGHVTLKVYDIMGKEIATLVDGTRAKGSYNVNFSMDKYHLASGIYIARFTAGKNTLTTKMILSK